MTKRLQVLMDDDELRSIQRLARMERVTTAEWVRQRLREARARRDQTGHRAQARGDPRGLPVSGTGPADRPDERGDRAGYLEDGPTS